MVYFHAFIFSICLCLCQYHVDAVVHIKGQIIYETGFLKAHGGLANVRKVINDAVKGANRMLNKLSPRVKFSAHIVGQKDGLINGRQAIRVDAKKAIEWTKKDGIVIVFSGMHA